jgi:tetratricopeptide (TPR) repeat protein
VLAPRWRPGAGGAPPTAEVVRRAATALVAFADRKGRTLPALEAARAAAPEGPEKRALSLAVIRAARSADRPADALRTADALLVEDPTSRPAFVAKAWALQRLRRPEELARAGEAMLARLPGDAEVLAALASAQLLARDLEGAARTWRTLIDSGQATPLAYNNAAWLELFRGGPSATALDWARRAVDQDRGAARASLNTLAAVYAALDRPAEAREIFLRSLGEGRPLAGADWFVAGRIAEGWGLTEAARTAYSRVKAEDAGDPTDARFLADRRLAALPP